MSFSIRGDVQELGGRFHAPDKRVRPPVASTFAQSLHSMGHDVKFWQACLKDTGLTMQRGQLLGTSCQSCPLRRGMRTCPTYRTAASHLCHCSLLLLTWPSRLWRGIKLRACSHAWPGCPGNKFNLPWIVIFKINLSLLTTISILPQIVAHLSLCEHSGEVIQAALCQSECFLCLS